MSKLHIEFSIEQLKDVAQQVLKHVNSKTLLFYGEMGVGKTTLINELVKALDGKDETSSPTFSIVNEYEVKNDLVYHFDFYRINDEVEALDIGVEDYFYSKHWCFIEWPEKIASILPDNVSIIKLALASDFNKRVLILN